MIIFVHYISLIEGSKRNLEEMNKKFKNTFKEKYINKALFIELFY